MEQVQQLVQYLENKLVDTVTNGISLEARVGIALVIILPYPVYLAWRRYQNYPRVVDERRSFSIYTAMDDLSVLGTQTGKRKMDGTAVIAGGR
jgi:hypothetical protein